MATKKGAPEDLRVVELRVELPVEVPGPGQLRVRVRAAGVGSTDLMVLAGKYRYAPKFPLAPGYEIAGVVDAIGTGSIDRLVRALQPESVDRVFDAVGGSPIGRCVGALRPGGMLVGFGFMGASGALSQLAHVRQYFRGSALAGTAG
jgi:NADPH:quinone reductase-like Zn-dependent oxidoreductase